MSIHITNENNKYFLLFYTNNDCSVLENRNQNLLYSSRFLNNQILINFYVLKTIIYLCIYKKETLKSDQTPQNTYHQAS